MSLYYYDKEAAEGAVRFIERHIRHVKGEWAAGNNPLIKLEEWQKKDILYPLFGWKHKEKDKTGINLRKYRTAYIEIPRKNAKTTLIASIGVIMLILGNEPGSEIYCVAADRDQASIVFDIAKSMILADETLSGMCQVYKNAILYNGCALKVISADVAGKHGYNASVVIFDELHTQKTRDLYDVMRTSIASRRQPMFIMITTAGDNFNSICWEQHEKATQILNGQRKDDSYLPLIYAADPSDDPYKESTWKKANPNYGVSVKPEYLKKEAENAKHSPTYENTFKRLHLNIWTNSQEKWITDLSWSKSGGKINSSELIGRPCNGGLDLSSTSDLTAFTLIFPPIEPNQPYISLNWFWLPEDKGKDSANKNNLNYSDWVKNGFVEETPGNVVDYDVVQIRIQEIYNTYKPTQIGYDPHNAAQIIPKLQEYGLPMYLHRQGFISMNVPSKEFERVVNGDYILSDGTRLPMFNHGNNPVLDWMIQNCSIDIDASQNIKPSRKRKDQKIDGIVTNIMAIGLCLVADLTKGSYLDDLTEAEIIEMYKI